MKRFLLPPPLPLTTGARETLPHNITHREENRLKVQTGEGETGVLVSTIGHLSVGCAHFSPGYSP